MDSSLPPFPISSSPSTASSCASDHAGVRMSKIELYCEICVNSNVNISFKEIINAANCWLASSGLTVALGRHCPQRVGVPLLARCCSSICIEPANLRILSLNKEGINSNKEKDINHVAAPLVGSCRSSLESHPMVLPYCQTHITVFPYKLHEGMKEGGSADTAAGEEECDQDAAETDNNSSSSSSSSSSLYNQWLLPNKEFNNLWESLYYEEGIKETLLEYSSTSLLFASRNVNPKLITCNRMLLLHGPPGTGKTSLCKALGNKLSIRLSLYYSSFIFISINSSCLFSCYYSETGKRINNLFIYLRKLINNNKNNLLFILMDEVESLSLSRSTAAAAAGATTAAAAAAAAAAAETAETLRAVNTLLTQLDHLSSYANVMILTTSNLPNACDGAFLDRVDIKLYISSPNDECRSFILYSSLQELIRTELIAPPPTKNSHKINEGDNNSSNSNSSSSRNSNKIKEIIRLCKGLSGRTLRKIPFLAYGQLTQLGYTPSVDEFWDSVHSAVYIHLRGQTQINLPN